MTNVLTGEQISTELITLLETSEQLISLEVYTTDNMVAPAATYQVELVVQYP